MHELPKVGVLAAICLGEGGAPGINCMWRVAIARAPQSGSGAGHLVGGGWDPP